MLLDVWWKTTHAILECAETILLNENVFWWQRWISLFEKQLMSIPFAYVNLASCNKQHRLMLCQTNWSSVKRKRSKIDCGFELKRVNGNNIKVEGSMVFWFIWDITGAKTIWIMCCCHSHSPIVYVAGSVKYLYTLERVPPKIIKACVSRAILPIHFRSSIPFCVLPIA